MQDFPVKTATWAWKKNVLTVDSLTEIDGKPYLECCQTRNKVCISGAKFGIISD